MTSVAGAVVCRILTARTIIFCPSAFHFALPFPPGKKTSVAATSAQAAAATTPRWSQNLGAGLRAPGGREQEDPPAAAAAAGSQGGTRTALKITLHSSSFINMCRNKVVPLTTTVFTNNASYRASLSWTKRCGGKGRGNSFRKL